MPQQPEIAQPIFRIPVDQVELGTRIREVVPAKAEALSLLIAKNGQDTPIEVCRLPGSSVWRLVSGAHRLAAVRLLDRADILAVEVSASDIERQRREIGENIFRTRLDPYERACFIARLHDLLRSVAGIPIEKTGRSLSADARWAEKLEEQAADARENFALAYGFVESIADEIGLSVRAIKYDLTLARRLRAADVERLRNGANDACATILRKAAHLHALAKLDEPQRDKVIGLLVDGTASSLAEAIGLVEERPAAPTREEKRLSAFRDKFGAMDAGDRMTAITYVVEKLGRATADHMIDQLKRKGWL